MSALLHYISSKIGNWTEFMFKENLSLSCIVILHPPITDIIQSNYNTVTMRNSYKYHDCLHQLCVFFTHLDKEDFSHVTH